MTNDIIEMIQAEVDGQNAPDVSSRLAELSRQDPEIRKELDAALAVGKALDTLSDAQVPEGFAARIMDALPDEPAWARHRHVAPDRTAVRSARPAGIFTRRPLLNLAYGLVVGVFVTVAAMSVLRPDPASIEGASGTMMMMDDAPVFKEIIEIDGDHSVEVSIWDDEAGLTTRIDGSIPDDATTSIVIALPDGRQVTIPVSTP